MAACKADYQDCDISAPVKTLHCNVTAAYVRECKRHGIEMPLPDECCECLDFSHNMLDWNSERVSKTKKVKQKTNLSKKTIIWDFIIYLYLSIALTFALFLK